MLRSELIEILQNTTRDYERDGEVMISIMRKAGESNGVIEFEPDSEMMPIIFATEATGWGEAITLLNVVGDD